MTQRTGPLAGKRVIEMGVLLAGPFCGQLLADYGAEVIKIEQPVVGDPMRQWGREKPHGKSLWWPVVARNKKSITLNLRVEEGQQIVKDLVKDADFLIENFRPGTMERWGLGWEDLKEINPGLVMIRVTGFGQTGPYSSRAGYGAIGEAMGGLRYVVGDPDSAPARTGISIGDSLAATFGALGGLAALAHKNETGQGQVVDSAIYEAVLNMMESLVTEFDVTGYIRERTGAILPNVSPSNVFPTSDDQLVLIAANQDTVFSRLAVGMGRPELAEDERYSTHGARGAHQQELDDLIADWTRTITAAQLEAVLEEHGVPYGGIYRAPEIMADPHIEARNALVQVEHPEFGPITMQNVAPKFSETPGSVDWVGPELGAHNEEIFRDLLGIDEAGLAGMADRGII